MPKRATRLIEDRGGAVAATVALSLFALIAVGGIAFDYSRLATLDSELQDAADQAALAAVTQLDQTSGSMQRATAAAQSLLTNRTLMANDSNASGTAVTVPTVVFYATKVDAEADTNGFTAVGSFATARFVRVAVAARKAFYALTPIVGAFNSGDLSAEAVAGLGTAICKVPPVMICNPDEPNVFDANALAGRGLRLVSVGNGSTAWAPGNFGYLDTGSSTSNPNVELRQALGWTTAPGDCSGLDGVQTRTGAGTSAVPALNTRFDIYEKAGGSNSDSCPPGGSCPPSINTTKDVVLKSAPTAANKCDFKKNEWEEPAKPYLPTSSTADLDLSVAANVPDAMGHPRDKCHAVSINGSCTYNSGSQTKIGNGAWDRNAYFFVNYGWNSTQWPTNIASGSSPITTSTPTRYQVYLWEIANRGTTIGGKVILAANGRAYGSGGNASIDYDQPKCSQLQPYGSGIVPGGTNVDRRRISAAVLNCTASNVHGGGGTVYPVQTWIELFLVEPSLSRTNTDKNDVYVEIIGKTTLGGGATAGQVIRRDVPYLIK